VNTLEQQPETVKVPEKLAPIFVALIKMDTNLKKIVKQCDPTYDELQWVIDFERHYTAYSEKNIGNVA